MNNLKQWYTNLAKREQNLVNAASVVLFIGLFFQLIIGPINQGVAKAEQDLANKKKLLVWVQENASKIKASESKAGKSTGSLSTIVNNSARRYQVKISGTKPQGKDLQVQLDKVRFDDLLKWLDHLVHQQHLKITLLDVASSDSAGEVKVRRLQLAK